jgi:hypothetical protein
MVPPMLKTHSIKALQRLAKHSDAGRRPIIAKDEIVNVPVNARIEYLLLLRKR